MGLIDLDKVELRGKNAVRRAPAGVMMRVSISTDKYNKSRVNVSIYKDGLKKYGLGSYNGVLIARQKNYIIFKPSDTEAAYTLSKTGSSATVAFSADNFDFIEKEGIYIYEKDIHIENGYIVIDYITALDKETSNEIAPIKLTKQQFMDKELKSAYYYVSQGIDAHSQPIQSINAYLSGARTRAERDWLLYSKEN